MTIGNIKLKKKKTTTIENICAFVAHLCCITHLWHGRFAMWQQHQLVQHCYVLHCTGWWSMQLVILLFFFIERGFLTCCNRLVIAAVIVVGIIYAAVIYLSPLVCLLNAVLLQCVRCCCYCFWVFFLRLLHCFSFCCCWFGFTFCIVSS